MKLYWLNGNWSESVDCIPSLAQGVDEDYCFCGFGDVVSNDCGCRRAYGDVWI